MRRQLEGRDVLEPVDSCWDPARSDFEARRVRWTDLGGDRDRKLDGVSTSVLTQFPARTEVRVGGLRSNKSDLLLRLPPSHPRLPNNDTIQTHS
jgi:hypothetical protein